MGVISGLGIICSAVQIGLSIDCTASVQTIILHSVAKGGIPKICLLSISGAFCLKINFKKSKKVVLNIKNFRNGSIKEGNQATKVNYTNTINMCLPYHQQGGMVGGGSGLLGLRPYNRPMGMCRWMGSHFHAWNDYDRVLF